MPIKKDPENNKKIAPAKVWATLSLTEKERTREVLIQIVEEVLIQRRENSSDDIHGEIVIDEATIH